MHQKLLFPVLFCLLIGLVAAKQPDDPAALLATRALGSTPLISDLQELCDRVGGRPSGSPACERAIEWGIRKFKEAGLERVTTETFSVPLFWLPESAEVSCLSPASFSIRAAAAPFSPSSPEGGLEARLVDAGEGTSEDFKKLGDSARGSVALVRSGEMKTFDDLMAEYFRNSVVMSAAEEAGVKALLLQSSRPRGLLYRHPMTLGGRSVSIPAAVISREHAERLIRLAHEGEVRVRLDLRNRTGGSYESRNVIAEIRGREKPDEIVLLGAHLDSWELGTGAEDNGVNAVMVIDVARAFQQLHLVPRRTIRFVLFTGEEQGMWGSAGYVQRHAGELDHHVAAVIYDTGSGRTTGFFLNGRRELNAPLQQILQRVAGVAPMNNLPDGIDGTDNFDFLLSGVPNLVADQDPAPYLADYHAETDEFERVNQREARMNDAVAAILVWGLAEMPEPFGVRQTRAQVEQLLKATKLDEQMKGLDQWDSWLSGNRGILEQ